jgi:hypothetical protein
MKNFFHFLPTWIDLFSFWRTNEERKKQVQLQLQQFQKKEEEEELKKRMKQQRICSCMILSED